MNVVPTFEDLSIDDALTPVDRVIRYSRSKIALQRLVHLSQLAEVAEAIGYEAAAGRLLPLLPEAIADEQSAVRAECAAQVLRLARFCAARGGAAGYRTAVETLLPLLAALAGDAQEDVRAAAAAALAGAVALLRPEDRGARGLTVALRLAHDNDREEVRAAAAAALARLAPLLGADLAAQFLVPEAVSLAEDPVFRVRKAAAQALPAIAAAAGARAAADRLLPALAQLAQDDVYRVRRAAADALPAMAAALAPRPRPAAAAANGPGPGPSTMNPGEEPAAPAPDPTFTDASGAGGIATAADGDQGEHRAWAKQLLVVFHSLERDELTQQSALEALGPLVAALPSRVATAPLVRLFSGMAADAEGQRPPEEDLRERCAWAFPAVARAVVMGAGREEEEEGEPGQEGEGRSSGAGGAAGRWERTGLRAAHAALARDPAAAVRRAAAAALAAVAGAVAELTAAGEEEGGKGAAATGSVAARDLGPAFALLLEDTDARVRGAAVGGAAAFLGALPPRARGPHRGWPARALAGVGPLDWRGRRRLARQLGPCCALWEEAAAAGADMGPGEGGGGAANPAEGCGGAGARDGAGAAEASGQEAEEARGAAGAKREGEREEKGGAALTAAQVHLAGPLGTLARDPVAAVREAAFEAARGYVAALVGAAAEKGCVTPCAALAADALVAGLRGLATAPAYQERQMYIALCAALAQQGGEPAGAAAGAGAGPPPELVRAEFFPALVGLAEDPVISVRLALARALGPPPPRGGGGGGAGTAGAGGRGWAPELRGCAEVRAALGRLRGDGCADVAHFAAAALAALPGGPPADEGSGGGGGGRGGGGRAAQAGTGPPAGKMRRLPYGDDGSGAGQPPHNFVSNSCCPKAEQKVSIKCICIHSHI